MSAATLERAVERYARASDAALSPQWNAELREIALPDGIQAIDALIAALGWPAAQRLDGRPRPDQFPLLCYDLHQGWLAVEQWDSEETMLLSGERGTVAYHAEQTFFRVQLPDPLSQHGGGARAVFWRAIARRKRSLVMAGVATVFANLLTLATSLYSMQLYDRVIPLASFETLLVLTIGVLFALVLDLCLRALRAVLIEREAQEIDAEVSDFFFARAQAIRLDARPPGIGTMAAQLRGQEQIRQVMSSASLFMLADLPFAILFVAVVWLIGGPLALVPLVSLPIALAVAVGLSRVIRKGTERAQVSGNRKNGMLVESLDAAETIKANRGSWFMLGRWGRLVREINHYEMPVKQASALATSLFSALQQAAYIAVMGWGAYLAATGGITTGALLACSIIAGRINGPLVAQLPGLIVQWGYARSSLTALDQIMALPLEASHGTGALRPEAMSGSYQLTEVDFAYRNAPQTALDLAKLTISPGERVAVIGGIGSGKSTLLKVLSGLYHPRQGSVLLGNLDLARIADDVARRHIGYVTQDARLVNGTLRDNLVMGLGEVRDEDIMAAAKATRLDGLIAARQEGLALTIQEGGRGLSGGQRSLVGLTRLLLAQPKVWLLDEPTAALDQTTELAVLDAIDARLGKDQTLVMVTHKLPLLTRFTRIVVLAGGKIIRDGPTADVLRDMLPPAPPTAAGAKAPPPEGTVTTRIGARSGS